jgi:hypothetical protein
MMGKRLGFRKRLHWLVQYRTGWSIALSVALGIALVTVAFVAFAWRCWGHNRGDCATLRASPPWIPLAAVLSAPSTILTWYWRTDHKKKDIEHAEQGIIQREYDRKDAASRDVLARFASGAELLSKGVTGALYALESVALDSPREHWAVMETIAGYIRLQRYVGKSEEDAITLLAIQAAVKVIGRRDVGRDPKGRVLDLSETDLRDVRFDGLQFDNTRFNGVNVERADIRGGSFMGARFPNCRAQGVIIDDNAKVDRLALKELRAGGAQLWERIALMLKGEEGEDDAP